jgi:predicted DNA-binding protein with PD1-like motif
MSTPPEPKATPIEPLPVRLAPGADLRRRLEEMLAERAAGAAFVVAGIGSLSAARLRFAGCAEPSALEGDLELLTLSGTLAPEGAHLHATVADARGRVWGGHVANGCLVRTTAEVLIVLLPYWRFAREHDAQTGFRELCVQPARLRATVGPAALGTEGSDRGERFARTDRAGGR